MTACHVYRSMLNDFLCKLVEEQQFFQYNISLTLSKTVCPVSIKLVFGRIKFFLQNAFNILELLLLAIDCMSLWVYNSIRSIWIVFVVWTERTWSSYTRKWKITSISKVLARFAIFISLISRYNVKLHNQTVSCNGSVSFNLVYTVRTFVVFHWYAPRGTH